MPTNEGNCGRGARHYEADELNPSVLRGVLASDLEGVVYPEDSCLACIREGRIESERCFHRHWRVADERGATERRV